MNAAGARRRLALRFAWSLGGLALLSVLGGSVVWQVLLSASRLDIVGAAPVVRGSNDGEGVGWPAYGGDKGGGRFSAASEITPSNVRQLSLAWTLRTGALDDYLRAYDTETGRELWKGRLPAGGQATPMTYTFEGRQYGRPQLQALGWATISWPSRCRAEVVTTPRVLSTRSST